jgi:uridine kinase
MSDYDFRQLNDKEFEVLCADILGIVHGHRIERFKPGRDSGVDGRYFVSSNSEVVLQCKHWSNTPIRQLIHMLEKTEKQKLDKLKPIKYILAVSNPLSRSDKSEISKALFPYIKSDSEIYGKEDLNDLLKLHPSIERRHYKLWLHSTEVIGSIFNSGLIGRSQYSLEEIMNSSKLYAVTSNHDAALEILNNRRVVLISGEPGVGKTTLANHLCLGFIAEGFEYYKISEEIKEAESVFNTESKQIFYFDDFLGRNYLDALRGHEGNQVTQFIRRVSTSKNKRLILTSRTTILNQGKFLIDNFEHDNLNKNEFEIRIKSLSEIDKAMILYNHIFHSGMSADRVEQLYQNRRYRLVISHRNYNPRLINYITDPVRLENLPAENYWQHVNTSLDNPKQVWANPFEVQLDDFGRALVLLVVLHGYPINESVLAESYQRYITLPSSQKLQGRSEFLTNLRLLTGSFLNRSISSSSPPIIDLFNPSIGDYILNRHSQDATTILILMKCLRTTMSLFTLLSLIIEKHVSQTQANSICRSLLETICADNFSGTTVIYISKLTRMYMEQSDNSNKNRPELFKAMREVMAARHNEVTEDSYESIRLAFTLNILTHEDVVDFVKSHYEYSSSEKEIKSIISLLTTTLNGRDAYNPLVMDVERHLFSCISDDLSNYINIDMAFSNVDYGDQNSAEREIDKLLRDKLNELGAKYNSTDISDIISSYDIEHELYKYHQEANDYNEHIVSSPTTLSIDEIDELFDRG